jgi:hypothetical protein
MAYGILADAFAFDIDFAFEDLIFFRVFFGVFRVIYFLRVWYLGQTGQPQQLFVEVPRKKDKVRYSLHSHTVL